MELRCFVIFLLGYVFHFIQPRNIFINIKRGKAPIQIPLDNGKPTNCTSLQSFINVNRTHIEKYPQQSVYCNDTDENREFYIFVFDDTFKPYLYTLKAESNQTKDFLLQIGQGNISRTDYRAFVVTNTTKYTIYFLCSLDTSNNYCTPVAFDPTAFKNYTLLYQNLYSHCDKPLNCSTNYKFSSEAISLTTVAVPQEFSTNCEPSLCLNGGFCNSSSLQGFGSKCSCLNVSSSVGPRCEWLDKTLGQDTYYFFVLGNNQSLSIEFELFATSFKKESPIFTIPNADGNLNLPLIEYVQNEGTSRFSIGSGKLEISNKIDINKWLYYKIDISEKTFSVMIQGDTKTGTHNLVDLLLDRFPLILRNVQSVSTTNSVCIKNLKINNNLVDLYSKNSCCSDRCVKCVGNQTCACAPFKSESYSKCYCKFGFSSIKNECVEDNPNEASIQIGGNTTQTLPIVSEPTITNIQFRYRTVSTSGNLSRIDFKSPQYHWLKLEIQNCSYVLTASSESSSRVLTKYLNTYNASDGNWHTVDISVRNSDITMVLDENPLLQSLQLFSWTKNISNSYVVSSVTIGQMSQTKPNRTTCFLSMRFVDFTDGATVNPVTLSSFNVSAGCSDYPDCSTITCGSNSNCTTKDSWQDPRCICWDSFYMIDGYQCVNACLPNPCRNNGVCFADKKKNTATCTCPSGYISPYCAISLAEFWWIAVLIALLLLVFLAAILIYLCCCRQQPRKLKEPDINVMNENVVSYQDHAGEVDYIGPPINYNLLQNALKSRYFSQAGQPMPAPPLDLRNRKFRIEANNKDMVLDHPLDYGYEGEYYDRESVSSLGSGSVDSNLNTKPLDNSGREFDYLKNLYQ